jgi:hypothetical protein
MNEATSAARDSAIDRFPSRRGVQCSAITHGAVRAFMKQHLERRKTLETGLRR